MKPTLLRATVAVFLAVVTASQASAFDRYPKTSLFGSFGSFGSFGFFRSAAIPRLLNPTSGSVHNATVIKYAEYSSGTSATFRDRAFRVASIFFPRYGSYLTHPDLETGAHDAMRKLLKLAYNNQSEFRVSVYDFHIYRNYFVRNSNTADRDTRLTLNRTVWPSSREGELASATINGAPSDFYGTLTLYRNRNGMGQNIYRTFQLLRGPTSTSLMEICEGENFANGAYQSKSSAYVTRLEWFEVQAILNVVVAPTWGVLFESTLRPVDCAAISPPRNNNRIVHGGGTRELPTRCSNP